MPGRLQKVAALVAAAWGFAASPFAAFPAETAWAPASIAAPDAQRERAIFELSQSSALEKWSLRAGSYRGAWDATDASAFPRLDWRSAVTGDVARANLAFDWSRRLAAGLVDGGFFGRLARTEVGDGVTAATRFDQRLRDSAFGGALRWSGEGSAAGFAATHALSVGVRNTGRDAQAGSLDERGEFRSIREDRLDESALTLAASTEVFLPGRIRADAAIRYDAYRGAVRSDVGARAGEVSARVLSPRMRLRAPGPAGSEVFVAFSRGIDSDSRALTVMADPRTGAPVARLDPLADTSTVEIGFRRHLPAGIEAKVSMFRARSDLELLLSGESGITEFSRPTMRQGVQFAATYEPAHWLTLDFQAVALHARFMDGASEHVPGAAERGAAAAATIRVPAGWTASLMANYLGKRSGLDASSDVRASIFVNGRLSHTLSKSTRLTLDLFNMLGQRLHDVDYFSASRLSNPSAVSEGYLFDPAEPRGFRLQLRTSF